MQLAIALCTKARYKMYSRNAQECPVMVSEFTSIIFLQKESKGILLTHCYSFHGHGAMDWLDAL